MACSFQSTAVPDKQYFARCLSYWTSSCAGHRPDRPIKHSSEVESESESTDSASASCGGAAGVHDETAPPCGMCPGSRNLTTFSSHLAVGMKRACTTFACNFCSHESHQIFPLKITYMQRNRVNQTFRNSRVRGTHHGHQEHDAGRRVNVK